MKASATISRNVYATFLAKFVLEVLGAGGAIWGFSEACGLRHAGNVWFWRPAALSVASIFFLRWLEEIWHAPRQPEAGTVATIVEAVAPYPYQGVPKEEAD